MEIGKRLWCGWEDWIGLAGEGVCLGARPEKVVMGGFGRLG